MIVDIPDTFIRHKSVGYFCERADDIMQIAVEEGWNNLRRFPGITDPDVTCSLCGQIPLLREHVCGQVALFGFVLVLSTT